MSDEQSRPAAKDAKLDHQPAHPLTNYGEQVSRFNDQAQQSHMMISKESDPRDQITETTAGSDMIRAQGNQNIFRPPPEIARASDRNTHYEDLAADQQRYKDTQSKEYLDDYIQQAIEADQRADRMYGDDRSLSNDNGFNR